MLISFSVEPVLRFQCVVLGFGRRPAYRNPHPYPVQRNLAHGYTHYGLYNMEIRKTERSQMEAHSFSLIGNSCFKAGCDSIKYYNEPPRYRLHRNFSKIALCGSNLPDGYPVRRFSTYKLSGTPLKK